MIPYKILKTIIKIWKKKAIYTRLLIPKYMNSGNKKV